MEHTNNSQFDNEFDAELLLKYFEFNDSSSDNVLNPYEYEQKMNIDWNSIANCIHFINYIDTTIDNDNVINYDDNYDNNQIDNTMLEFNYNVINTYDDYLQNIYVNNIIEDLILYYTNIYYTNLYNMNLYNMNLYSSN